MYVFITFLPYGVTTLPTTYIPLVQQFVSGANKNWATCKIMGCPYHGQSNITLMKEKYLPDCYGSEEAYICTPQQSSSSLDFGNTVTNPMVVGNQPTAVVQAAVGAFCFGGLAAIWEANCLIKATLITRFSRFNILAK